MKHEEEMKGINLNQQIEANRKAAEVKKVMDEMEILAAKNQAMFEYIGSDMFKNPLNHLSKAYLKRMKEEEKNNLLNASKMLIDKNKELVVKINNDYEVNSDAIVKQVKYMIESQNKYYSINLQENQLLNNIKSTYNHLLKKQAFRQV